MNNYIKPQSDITNEFKSDEIREAEDSMLMRRTSGTLNKLEAPDDKEVR